MNQQNKIKQTLNKGNIFFVHTKTSKRVKVICFVFGTFLPSKLFRKQKKNRLESVLITSFYYATTIMLKFTDLFKVNKNKVKTTRKSLKQKLAFKKQPSKKKPITEFYDHI